MVNYRDYSWEELVSLLRQSLAKRSRRLPEEEGTDKQVWQETFERISRLSRRVLGRTGADTWPCDIEDITQQVMLKLQSYRILERLSDVKSVTGYLVVTLRNEARNVARKSSHDKVLYHELGSRQSLKSDLSDDNSLQDGLKKALASLSEEDRKLLHLKFWEDQSIQEIADSLGIRYSTAAVRLLRLVRKLGEKMDGER